MLWGVVWCVRWRRSLVVLVNGGVRIDLDGVVRICDKDWLC